MHSLVLWFNVHQGSHQPLVVLELYLQVMRTAMCVCDAREDTGWDAELLAFPSWAAAWSSQSVSCPEQWS